MRYLLVCLGIAGLLGTWGAACAQAQPPKRKVEGPIALKAQFTEAQGDQPALLILEASLEKGWHTFSVTQKKGGPIPTKITVEPSDKFEVLEKHFASSPEPTIHFENDAWPDLPLEELEGNWVWYMPIKLNEGVDTSKLVISGVVKAQRCKGSCYPPASFPFEARLGPGIPGLRVATASAPVEAPNAAPPSDNPRGMLENPVVTDMGDDVPPAVEPMAVDPMGVGAEAPAAVAGSAFDPAKVRQFLDGQSRRPLAVMLGFSFLGGLILNLMPCVLPVIGLKVMSFVQQSGQSRAKIFELNLWYTLGLMSVFMALATLAVVLQFGWGRLFQYPEFNIAVAAIVFAMALSFLGVWEIPIPGFVGGGTASELSNREGPAGAFLKGAITTVLATPCSGPFLGSALAFALKQPAPVVYAMFAAAGLGMASPYLLIGAFPSLVRSLPKPGAWMDTFKQLMGFSLLATVVYFLTFISAPLVVPTVSLLIGLWFACWWLGQTPFTAPAGLKVRAGIIATTIAVLVVFFSFGWLKNVMDERFGRAAERHIAKVLEEQKLNPQETIAWKPYTRQAFEDLVNQNQTVVVDFTADWCFSCKTLEATVLRSKDVKQALEQPGVSTLVADWTEYEDAREVDEMLKGVLGREMVPVLAIFPAGRPNEPILLDDGYTRGLLLEKIEEAAAKSSRPSTTSLSSRETGN